MSFDTLSKTPCLDCNYLYLNESTQNYVFNLSKFALDALEINLTQDFKNLEKSFNDFTLDFIESHSLERANVQDAYNSIFVNFDCAYLTLADAYDFCIFVDYALSVGLDVLGLSFDAYDYKKFLNHVTSILYNNDDLDFSTIDAYDCSIFWFLYNSKVRKGISYKCSIQYQSNTAKAPALLPALGINLTDNALMVNLTSYIRHVALTLNTYLNPQNNDSKLAFIEDEALFEALNFDSLHSCWLACFDGCLVPGDSKSKYRELFRIDGDVFIYYSFEVVKTLVLEVTRAACIDAIVNDFSYEYIAKQFEGFVKNITSILFTKQQQASIANYTIYLMAVNRVSFTLSKDNYYKTQSSLEDGFLELPKKAQGMPYESFNKREYATNI